MFIAKEGLPFIVIPAILGVALVLLGRFWVVPGYVLIIAALFCCYFFRDPSRTIPKEENLVLSPADGTIMEVGKDGDKKLIRIFLSVFNVHLQRAPVAGTVVSVEYKPGKFLPAMDKEAHIQNEQIVTTIKNKSGEYVVKQIAGILARRCVSWLKQNDEIKSGQKIGLIKFSSQVDISMPQSVEIKVKVGDVLVGGETIIAVLNK
jgi:phosphatidylserine decarboxylase